MGERGPQVGTLYKSIERHKAEGTYRPERHDPEPPAIDQKPIIKLPTLKETRAGLKSLGMKLGAADRLAMKNGCRFSLELAKFVEGWMAKYLRHSEGHWAGKPFELMPWQAKRIVWPLFGWVREIKDKLSPFHGRVIRRFNRAYVEIPKKNGKSPTGAAIGTYMLCGDGENGAKVFSAAASSEQASIVHKHAIHMIDDAPDLKANSKTNRTTKHIFYKPTRSFYQVISSEAKGQEGLNAHCIIVDELHAWRGDILWNALKFAGASRAEPITFAITTAGDDMQSVCRNQHDYANGVASGDIRDDAFLGVMYGAKKDGDWTHEKTWLKANPSYGYIIQPSEMRQSCEEAKAEPRLQNAFRRYRLNVWATAEEPWADLRNWGKCVATYTEDDLAGQPCYAGLDMGQTHDMTAFVLMFPDAEDSTRYRQLAYFWVPEAVVERNKHLAGYHEWIKDGWLTVTPGEVVDYGIVGESIASMCEQFDVRCLCYDPMYAEQLTQQLEENHGVMRIAMRQTITEYAGPTMAYGNAVREGLMHNNGNSVLTWQAQHVTVKEDTNGNMRPVKPRRQDYRCVDGIQAAIMALKPALAGIGTEASVYEERGLIIL